MEQKVSIIIPIFNEEQILSRYPDLLYPVLDELKSRYPYEFELILVNDGSSDRSMETMKEIGKLRPGVIITENEKNMGMGAAMKKGLSVSSGDLVVFLDADLTFRPEDIGRLLDAYQENPADCISGSPYLDRNSTRDVDPVRKLLSKTVNILYSIDLGKKMTSVSPIFRLYRKRVFTEIPIKSNNFEINAEILSKMIFADMTVREIPITLYSREHGISKSRLSRTIMQHVKILGKIFKVRYLGRPWE